MNWTQHFFPPHDANLLPVLPKNPQELARLIDHTLLKPDATPEQIQKHCLEADAHGFFSVCLHSGFVPFAKTLLKQSDTQVITVVGFPLGANLSSAKATEAALAINEGATEIDMVLPIGALKAGARTAVIQDIVEVVRACEEIPVKVIIETSLLTDAEKKLACQLSEDAGARWVKTSTGFSGGGATVADIQLMRAAVSSSIGVKASGGVRTYDDALKMIQAGARRLGTSAGVSILKGLPPKTTGETSAY